MEIQINQQLHTVTDFCSVRQLLQTVLPQTPTGIAVAVNNAIVPKSEWDQFLLQPSDYITIIKATQGG
jgi:sulfur carrier protein